GADAAQRRRFRRVRSGAGKEGAGGVQGRPAGATGVRLPAVYGAVAGSRRGGAVAEAVRGVVRSGQGGHGRGAGTGRRGAGGGEGAGGGGVGGGGAGAIEPRRGRHAGVREMNDNTNAKA